METKVINHFPFLWRIDRWLSHHLSASTRTANSRRLTRKSSCDEALVPFSTLPGIDRGPSPRYSWVRSRSRSLRR